MKFTTFGVLVYVAGNIVATCDTVERAMEISSLLNDAHGKATAKQIRDLNVKLSEITACNYHVAMPFGQITELIEAQGFNSMDFTNAPMAGNQGNFNVSIGKNVYLSFSWYKMESGKWEIVAYFS